MSLKLDPLTDLKLDGNREVFVDDTGDIATVTGIDNVEQSAAIHSGQAIRPLLGQPITSETLVEAQANLQEALERDPQLDSVQRVVIENIDRDTNTVEARVFVGVNNDFSISVTV